MADRVAAGWRGALWAAAVVLLSLPAMAEGPAPAEVSVCFTPGPIHCADMIADAIDAAHSTVRVQAYWFTSRQILRALAKAQARGVDVLRSPEIAGWEWRAWEARRAVSPGFVTAATP